MKAVGLFLTFLIPLLTGFLKSQEYAEKRNILHGFILLLYFIKHEVTFYLTPQNEIYRKFYDKTLSKIGFLDILENSQSTTPLKEALTLSKEKLLLEKDAYDLLYEFSSDFGTLSQKEENKRCERVISELEEIYKSQKEEINEKIRLCRTVGCMAGIGLVLLMW